MKNIYYLFQIQIYLGMLYGNPIDIAWKEKLLVFFYKVLQDQSQQKNVLSAEQM